MYSVQKITFPLEGVSSEMIIEHADCQYLSVLLTTLIFSWG